MKLVVVIGFASGSGKSVLAAHMLKPLLDATLINIVSEKNDDAHDLSCRVSKVAKLAAEIIVEEENFVIDVKASAAVKFIEACCVLNSFRDAVDCWVVPCMPLYKPKAAVATVEELVKIGVDRSRIAFVPNNIFDVDECRSQLDAYRAMRSLGIAVPDDFVCFSEAVERLSSGRRSVFDMVREKQDFQARKIELQKSRDEKGLLRLGHEIVLRDLCAHTVKNMRHVFNQLPALK